VTTLRDAASQGSPPDPIVLTAPSALATAGGGSLIVAEPGNDRVLKLVPAP
jgi:hypothetical protein